MITDWWLSPEVCLVRDPGTPVDQWVSVMGLLKRVADRGVVVHVQVYKELPVALPLNSAHTRDVLAGLSSNIRVVRHGAVLWSHHEKIVVVDRTVAFLGGLDLCLGRCESCSPALLLGMGAGRCMSTAEQRACAVCIACALSVGGERWRLHDARLCSDTMMGTMTSWSMCAAMVMAARKAPAGTAWTITTPGFVISLMWTTPPCA
jgi:hypothetical protein